MSADQNEFISSVKSLLKKELLLSRDSIAHQALKRLVDRERTLELICNTLYNYDFFKSDHKIAMTLIYFAQNFEWAYCVDPNYTRDKKRDIERIKKCADTILKILKGRRIGPIRDHFDAFINESYKLNPNLRGYSKSLDSLFLELLITFSKINFQETKVSKELSGIRAAEKLLTKINSEQSIQNLLAIVVATEFFNTTGNYLDSVNLLICEAFLNSHQSLELRSISSLRESIGLVKIQKITNNPE